VRAEGTTNENLPETHLVLKQDSRCISSRYPGRMLLAEANQWPRTGGRISARATSATWRSTSADAAMYMAIAQEDRTRWWRSCSRPRDPGHLPVGDLPAQPRQLTPRDGDQPRARLHVPQYAADRQARINLGIRGRLAPLMENDPERIKLMNSLLLSMPARRLSTTADELGMGDNIYLGDRNGVRTRCSGAPTAMPASRARPARLYLPPIMDAIYGYEAVNVEAQQRDPTFAPQLDQAHARRAQDQPRFRRASCPSSIREQKGAGLSERAEREAILVSRQPVARRAAVELDLKKYKGRIPSELLGRTSFPPIGD